MQKSEITDLILSCLTDVLADADAPPPPPAPLGPATPLVGGAAVVDSLGLVRLILEVEQRLAESHDVIVTLADERAMSQQRSPFRTVSALADYVEMLVREGQEGSTRAGS